MSNSKNAHACRRERKLNVNMANTARDGVRNRLITKYFFDGYPYRTILLLLGLHHGLRLSLRQLQRILTKLGLRRKIKPTRSHFRLVQALIHEELQGSSILLGYRALWHRLRQKYRIPIARRTVMKLLSAKDTKRRQKHRLKRRMFHSNGPNEVWQADGYDKLKPYGFAIHGCIDAFSRRVIWLQVSITNNDPQVIAWYYIRSVYQNGGAPKTLRCDCGTENSIIAFVHPYFRQDMKSFRYGTSVSNQRIEAFWSILRKWCTEWLNFFQGLKQEGIFDECNVFHRDSLRFSFMHLVQAELDDVVCQWNSHRIRCNPYFASGTPDELYLLPQLNGTTCRDHKTTVDLSCIAYAWQYCCTPPPPASLEFLNAIVRERNITHMPNTTKEALSLYLLLTNEFLKVNKFTNILRSYIFTLFLIILLWQML